MPEFKKKNKKMKAKYSIFLLFVSMIGFSSLASDYPKSKEDREKERMGSLVGGEGLTFRPFHSKNDSTMSSSYSNVNKYLWDATREVLSFMPESSVDLSSGSYITDWYSTQEAPKYSYKVSVTISGNLITPESIHVIVHEKSLKNGQWYNLPTSKKLSAKFEDKIIRKARDLHIQNSNNKN